MKIYRSVEAVPSRLEGILDVLHAAGGKGYSRETLIQLVQPVPIRNKEDADTLASNSLGALLELSDPDNGLVLEKEDERGQKRLLVGPSLRSEDRVGFRASAKDALRTSVLRETVDGKANQFAELMAWMSWLPSHGVPQEYAEWKSRLKANGLDLEGYGLANDARWDNVFYWGRYAGLLWRWRDEKGKGIVPDATEFICDNLTQIHPGGRLPFEEFRTRLGAACCALDGGTVHGRIGTALAASGAIGQDHPRRVSPSVSAALRGLRDLRVLDYDCPNDQREFFLMTGDEKIAFVSDVGARR